MSLSLFLQAGITPQGSQLPGNTQALANFMAQYVLVVGGQNFTGMNFGPSTPSPDDRDKPWLQTDTFGNPIGLFTWNGAAWVTFPVIVPNGPSTNRPINPQQYTEYFDNTINTLLVFERGQWRTASGSPGDIKFVTADNIAAALANNPGWVEYSAAWGRVIGAAGTGSGLTTRNAGDTIGEETHMIAITELPAHTHTLSVPYLDGTSSPNGSPVGGDTTKVKGTSTFTTDPTGGGVAMNVMQPTLFAYCLTKQ